MVKNIHAFIAWVRQLRHIKIFLEVMRFTIVVLMALGVWVATKKLDFPETLNLNDKVIHAFVFFSFSVLMDLATARHPFWLWKGLPLLAYGAFIEVLQYFSPDRSFSLFDLAADLFGILLYFILKEALIWLDSQQTNK